MMETLDFGLIFLLLTLRFSNLHGRVTRDELDEVGTIAFVNM